MQAEDKTIYAKWEINQYTISFEENGGPTIDSLIQNFGTDVLEPTEPIREGYTFIGWYNENDYSTTYTFTTMQAVDITIYAKWEINQYSITFETNGGTTISSITEDFDTVLLEPNEPFKEGYLHMGWFSDSNFSTPYTFTTMPSQDLTIYVKWEIGIYNLTYVVLPDDTDLSMFDVILEPGETIVNSSLGYLYSAILTSNGRVFTWGTNGFGQLGDGTTIGGYVPIDITDQFGLDEGEVIVDISLGSNHASAITSNGRVFTWGNNYYGELGNGETIKSSIPIDITNHFNLDDDEVIVSMKLGSQFSIAITSKNRVFTWGRNDYGQLGDGTNLHSFIPKDITNQFNLSVGEDIIDISVGYYHASVLTSLGQVFMWGYNQFAQIGEFAEIINYPIIVNSMFELSEGESIISIELEGYYSSAFTSLGQLFMWGDNRWGQLGYQTGINNYSAIPTDISNYFNLNVGEVISSVDLGGSHTSILTSDNRVFIWGNNGSGMLGTGNFFMSFSPLDITGQFELLAGENIVQVNLGAYYSSAITSFGRVFIWGLNGSGNYEPMTHSLTPVVPIIFLFINNQESYTYLDSIEDYTLSKAGAVFDGWDTDVLLTTPFEETSMPGEDIVLYAKWNYTNYDITYELNGAENNEANELTYRVIDELILHDPVKEGYVFLGWYDNDSFIGNPITEISIGSLGDITVYAKWEIGNFTVTYYVLPDEIDLSVFNTILEPGEFITIIELGGLYSAALTSEGRLFTWGNNFEGQLGDGTTSISNKPIDITDQFDLVTGETIISVSLGYDHSTALTSLGRLFSWGNNDYGQLGNGSTTRSSIPIDITGNFNLSFEEEIISVSLGNRFTSVLTSKGRIFTWGYNGYGELGDGSTNDSKYPIDITAQFNLNEGEMITSLELGYYHSSVLTSENRVFTWGNNNYGQLGNNTTNNSSIPIDITAQFNLNAGEIITSVELGYNHSSALTSENRMFTWGVNSSGQLGTSTNISSIIPIDITSEFIFNAGEVIISVNLGSTHSSALTSMGRLFTWGSNGSGELGDGTQISSMILQEITDQFMLHDGELIISVSLGHFHSSAKTSEGRIFTWGYNGYGELGDGTNLNSLVPLVPIYVLSVNSQVSYTYLDVLSDYTLTKEGAIFDGWYTDVLLTIPFTETTMPGEDIVLYAKWNYIEYTINYEVNGGSNNEDNVSSYIVTDEVILDDAFKEGYNFLGWYDNELFNGNPITELSVGS